MELLEEAPNVNIYVMQEHTCSILYSQVKAKEGAYLNDFEFKNGLGLILKYLKQTGYRHWLSDTRKMGIITPEAQAYNANEWIVQALAESNLKYCAAVIPADVFGQMSMEAIKDQIEDTQDLDAFQTQYFDDLEQAKKWLCTLP